MLIPLSDCTVSLLQNENKYYQLVFQSGQTEILNDIMALIYTKYANTDCASSKKNKSLGIKASKYVQIKNSKSRFLVRRGDYLIPITLDEIAYFFMEGRHMYLTTNKGVIHKMNGRIEDVENAVDPKLFFRVNRGMIVSYDSIVEVSSYNGKMCITTAPEFKQLLVVSKDRVKAFKAWLDT